MLDASGLGTKESLFSDVPFPLPRLLPRRLHADGLDGEAVLDQTAVVGHGCSASSASGGMPSSTSMILKSVTSLIRFNLGSRSRTPLKLTTLLARCALARNRVMHFVQVRLRADLLPLIEQGEADLAGRQAGVRKGLATKLVHESQETVDPRLGQRSQLRGEDLRDVEHLLPQLDLTLRFPT